MGSAHYATGADRPEFDHEPEHDPAPTIPGDEGFCMFTIAVWSVAFCFGVGLLIWRVLR